MLDATVEKQRRGDQAADAWVMEGVQVRAG